MIDDFKSKVKAIFGEKRQFSMILPAEEMSSVSELLYTEDVVNEFTNGLLWSHECEDISNLRKDWTRALIEERMDERLAIRVM